MSLTFLPDADKLQVSNWNQWKRTMTSILRMKGLMGYADGNIRPPSRSYPLQTSINATPATSTPAAPVTMPSTNPFALAQVTSSNSNPFVVAPQQAPSQSTGQILGVSPAFPGPSITSSHAKPLPRTPLQQEEWSRLDAAAATHITLNIKNQAILSKFREGASAYEIWSSLCTRFERTNGILALQARNRLNSCRYMDGQDVQSHLDTMSKLWEGALATGVAIPDNEFCHVLRSSFPSSWVLFITTLVTIGDPVVLEASLLAFADL